MHDPSLKLPIGPPFILPDHMLLLPLKMHHNILLTGSQCYRPLALFYLLSRYILKFW